jgi:polyvinyl alcohol dehydrogenase (cytochrome)
MWLAKTKFEEKGFSMRSLQIPLRVLFCAGLSVLFLSKISVDAAPQGSPVSGPAVYQKRCASCHDQADSHAPKREALQKFSAKHILRSLDFGMMMGVSGPMKRDEREAVASFLGTGAAEAGPPASAFCAAGSRVMSGPARGSWNGWSPDISNTRYQTAEQAGLTTDQVRHLKLKWAYGFSGDITSFAAPTVLDGTLFMGSAGGTVQAVNAKTGCLYWVFEAGGPVRSAIRAARNGPSYSLLFTDLNGGVYSLEAKTGRLLWKRRVEDHEATRLTGSPVALNGVVYIPAASWEETRSTDPQYECCTFRGSLTALRVRDGSVVWKSYMIDPPKKTGVNSSGTPQWAPSGAGIWSAPTVDTKRGVLYVTTGDNYSFPATATSDAVAALDIKTGRIVWMRQILPGDAWTGACLNGGPNCPADNGPDFDFGSSALLLHLANGRDILAAGQKSGVVYALDPDQKGNILWQTRIGKGGVNGGIEWGMASDGQQVYAAVSDLPRPTAGPSGPIGDATFDPTVGGGLAALRVEDGKQVWSVPGHPCDPPRPGCSPAQPGAVTVIPGIVFSGSIDGHVRAFSSEDGEVLWDFDTAKEYATVNGIQAKGGSVDGAGPVVVNGIVYVNSGYPRFGGMPGNVLLAFGPVD